MNLHRLADFFSLKVGPELILDEIEHEVQSYRKSFEKTGTSRSIYVTEDDLCFAVGPKHMRMLCAAYFDGQFSEWHLTYICNVLDLSTSFTPASDLVGDAIFRLADPEVNFPLTGEEMLKICNSLGSYTSSA